MQEMSSEASSSNNNNNSSEMNIANNNNKVTTTSPWADLPLVAKVSQGATNAQEIVAGLHSNDVVVLRDNVNSHFVVKPNQRCNKIIMINCTNCELMVLDSAVITSQTTVLINCEKCKFVFEDVDMRKVECYGVRNCEVTLIESLPLIEYTNVHWRSDCHKNAFQIAAITSGKIYGMGYRVTQRVEVPDVEENGQQRVSYIDGLKNIQYEDLGISKEEHLSSTLELETRPLSISNDELTEAYDAEHSQEEILAKVKEIAVAMRSGRQHVVCYTGAGISTSANVPDYRGPQGLWTMKEKGISTGIGLDFGEIRPTYAHYAITALAKRRLIHYVISTNMDALHMRSGLPPHLICEQHGNSHKEICRSCGHVYYRVIDVAEDSEPMSHLTDRRCGFCSGDLMDTIVNFAENLHDADQMASLWNCRKSTISLVLGTSMNVQPAASYPLECLKNDGKLFIVNLQRTPYDELAATRVFAKTDLFMKLLLSELNIDTNLDMSVDTRNTWDEVATPASAHIIITAKPSGKDKEKESGGILNRVFGKRS